MMLRIILLLSIFISSSVWAWSLFGDADVKDFHALSSDILVTGWNRSRRELMEINTRRMMRRMYVIRCCARRSCRSYARKKRPKSTTTTAATEETAPEGTTLAPETTITDAVTTTVVAVATTVAPVVTTLAPVTTTLAPITTTLAPITTTKAAVVVTTAAPAAACPVCGAAATCVKDNKLFDAKGLINPSVYGQWANGQCGTFLVSTLTKSHPDAYAECCRLGMTLMSADSIPKIQCFGGAVQGKVAIGPGNAFWTSAVGCNSKYTWCPANAAVVMDGFASAWKGGGPTAVGPPGDCVSLTLQVPAMPGAIVSNVDCKNVQTYVCEGPVTPPP